MTVLLSLQPQVITDSSGLPTRDFRNWQLAVTNAVNAPAETTPAPPVPPVSGDYLPLSTFVRGVGGVAWTGTLETGGVLLSLETVADSGAGALRGITRDSFGRVTGTTNATITGTAGQITVANGDAVAGPPTLSLADVTDAGGGSLLLTTFDAKGRQTGSSAATAADVPIADAGGYFTGTDVEAALQELGAGGGGSPGAWTTIVKPSDESRGSTTTFADDTHLTVALAAGTTYAIRGVLEVTLANQTAGFKYQFAYSGTTAFIRSYRNNYSTTGTGSATTNDFTLNTNAYPSGVTSGGTHPYVRQAFEITITTGTAGTLSLQWAQVSSSASATVLHRASYLEVMAP